jgi:hypothetical protein
MASKLWADGRAYDRMAVLLREGLSFSEIAVALNGEGLAGGDEKFTRNACLSKANRNKLRESLGLPPGTSNKLRGWNRPGGPVERVPRVHRERTPQAANGRGPTGRAAHDRPHADTWTQNHQRSTARARSRALRAQKRREVHPDDPEALPLLNPEASALKVLRGDELNGHPDIVDLRRGEHCTAVVGRDEGGMARYCGNSTRSNDPRDSWCPAHEAVVFNPDAYRYVDKKRFGW